MILTVGVCLLLAAVPVMAQSAADEAAIREMLEKDDALYNNGDSKGQAALRVENFENWAGTMKGRAAWIKANAEGRESQKDIQYKPLEEIGIFWVTPDVAIFKERAEYVGMVDEDGKPLPPAKILWASVVVKKDGKWLQAAAFQADIQE